MKMLYAALIVTCLILTERCLGSEKAADSIVLSISASKNNGKLLSALGRLLSELGKNTGNNQGGCKNAKKNCAEVLKCGGKQSGVYTIDPDGKGPFKVYCDQSTEGGGWTDIQKRIDGSVDFYRGWHDYKKGFGNVDGEYWLGLDKIHRLTSQTRNRLRVDLQDTKGSGVYADYDYFAVSSENTKYKLSIGTYLGTAGDSMAIHRDMPFTTKDRDNDPNSKNCAVLYKGAWWYQSCYNSNLNGVYHHGKSGADGIIWETWRKNYSPKRAEMKIKPA